LGPLFNNKSQILKTKQKQLSEKDTNILSIITWKQGEITFSTYHNTRSNSQAFFSKHEVKYKFEKEKSNEIHIENHQG